LLRLKSIEDGVLPVYSERFLGKFVNGSRAERIDFTIKSTSYLSSTWVEIRIASIHFIAALGIWTLRKSIGKYHCRSVACAIFVPTYHSGESGTFRYKHCIRVIILKILRTIEIAEESAGIFGAGGRFGNFGRLMVGTLKSILRSGKGGNCGIGPMVNHEKLGPGISGNSTG
jgi:hypothetical protein